MKHLLIVGPYPMPGSPIRGGVERVVDTFLAHAPKHMRVTLLAPGSHGDLKREKNGVDIIHLRRSWLPGALAYWTLDSWRLRQIIRRLRPDVVHIQGASGYGLFWPGRFFVTVHGIPQLDAAFFKSARIGGKFFQAARAGLISAVERIARRKARRIVLINPYVADALPDVKALATRQIPNPVDDAFISRPLQLGRVEPRRFLCVGKICARKNTLGVLQLFSAIAATCPEARLALCGAIDDANYVQKCRDFAREQNIDGRIEWLADLDRAALADQYDRAELMLMTSAQETAPMAIAEAHARGLPVAAEPKFGVSAMIEGGANGIALRPDEPSKQATQIITALEAGFDRNAIAQAARRTYEPAAILRATLAFYEETEL